jgi:pyruvate dehydrogenase E2 component (dihydrolipoamide acetyltransferase)
MPSLGADMEAGTLVEWLVKPGQKVKRGDVVAVVETQKGAVEVEIWEDGIVDTLVIEPGTLVPVGEVLATLRSEGIAAPGPATQPAPAPRAPALSPRPAPATASAERIRISPAARRRAQELGVPISNLIASSPDGIISIADVEQAAHKISPQMVKQAAMRQAIGAAMAKSKREIPHYYLGNSIDVTHALGWLAQENTKRSVKERILFAAVLLRAVAVALKETPELNGLWIDQQFRPSAAVHLGVGIALRGGGLVAPAIHDAQDKRVPEIMSALADLVQRSRSGGLRSSELTDATITVTNLGEQGAETVYGVIYPPQVALVGFGRMVERPWVKDGAVQIRSIVQATLCADHRASVGHRGALFLTALERLLQEPETL